MPTTLTLKNVPDEVHDRLKWSAETHRRSINNEAILCLESVLLPMRVSVNERLMRARALRKKLGVVVSGEDVDALKRDGRA